MRYNVANIKEPRRGGHLPERGTKELAFEQPKVYQELWLVWSHFFLRANHQKILFKTLQKQVCMGESRDSPESTEISTLRPVRHPIRVSNIAKQVLFKELHERGFPGTESRIHGEGATTAPEEQSRCSTTARNTYGRISQSSRKHSASKRATKRTLSAESRAEEGVCESTQGTLRGQSHARRMVSKIASLRLPLRVLWHVRSGVDQRPRCPDFKRSLTDGRFNLKHRSGLSVLQQPEVRQGGTAAGNHSRLSHQLKVGKNKATGAQMMWLDRLRKGGNRAYLWTPDSWDEIQRVASA